VYITLLIFLTITVFTLMHRVRFAKGAFAPKGQIYYPVYIPQEIDFKKAITKAIKATCRDMLAPMPIIGVNGMKYVAKQIRKWPAKLGVRKANHYLAQIVRMQEEIGTGGGGFRFIYAAFLQEASVIMESETLKQLSAEMTEIGDMWRDFALEASRVYKQRSAKQDVYNVLADQLLAIANREQDFFKKLRKAV
jgi:hypothetical protein